MVWDRDAREVLIIDARGGGGIIGLSRVTSRGSEVARYFWYRHYHIVRRFPTKPKPEHHSRRRDRLNAKRALPECDIRASYDTGRAFLQRTRWFRQRVYARVKEDAKHNNNRINVAAGVQKQTNKQTKKNTTVA